MFGTDVALETLTNLGVNVKNRVVITGIGIVTPIGNGIQEFWKALLEGRSGVSNITLFDTSNSAVKIGGEVKNLDFASYIPPVRSRKMSRTSKLAVVAAKMAIDNAALELTEELKAKTDIYMGVACPDLRTIEETIERRMKRGEQAINPLGAAAAVTAAPAGNISIELGISGEVITLSTGCSSSTNAIGHALRRIRSGESNIILAGGADVGIQMDLVASYANARALSIRNDHPQEASRPFEANRDGQVLSEAAGVLVLEDYEHARKRNACIYAEISGYFTNADCFSMISVAEDHKAASQCLEKAIVDARIDKGHVDYYCAHGSSAKLTDVRETRMLKEAFREQAYNIPVSSIKSMIGHPFGASGVLQAATCALSIKTGAIPPTINYRDRDPNCDLDYVPNEARNRKIDCALTYALGVGGNNSALVVKKL